MPAMLTPRMRQRPPDGQLWAADTGCFASPQDYDDDRYLAWLRALAPMRDRCLFATAPDVVGDAEATLARSLPMLPRIRAEGYPAALVAQDGLTIEMTPWDAIDALFVGGTTAWKLSEDAIALAVEAQRRGKWTHCGRVNSERRFLAMAPFFDSADGTFLAFGPTVNRRRVDRWLRRQHHEPSVWQRETAS